MAYGLFFIVGSAVVQFFIAIFVLIWRVLVISAAFFQDLFTSLFDARWLRLMAIFVGMIVLGLVFQSFQSEIMASFDVVYECGLSPAFQFIESFGDTILKTVYDFTVPRWNDIVKFWMDCVSEFIDDIRMIAPLTSTVGYTDIISAIYDLWKCVTSSISSTPSWQIPFLSDGITAIYSIFFCYTDFLRDIFFAVVNVSLFNFDCTFCALDPNANCVLRQAVPGTGVIPPGPACIGCESFECRYTECVALTWDVFTEPIQFFSGINLTPIFDGLSDIFCCILSQTWRPPFWLITGLIDGCIPFNPFVIVDFLTDDWLDPWVSCFNDLISFISGGVVGDFFALLFSIIFSFIQEVIDAVQLLLTCYQSAPFIGCLTSYPTNCMTNANGIATAGLQTCFGIAGNCIAAEGNPLLSNFFFQTIIPSSFIPIDTAVCSIAGLQVCFFGPTPPDGLGPTLPDCPPPNFANPLFFFEVPQCILTCIQNRVTLFSTVASILNQSIGFFSGFLNGLIGDLIAVFNSIVNIQSAIEEILELIENIEEVLPLSAPHNLAMVGGQMLLSTWHQKLTDYGVSQNTTCGAILWETDPYTLNRTQYAQYTTFWACAGAMQLGHNKTVEYNNDPRMHDGSEHDHGYLDINEFLDVSTYRNYTEKMAAMDRMHFLDRLRYDTMNMTYSYEELRSMPGTELNFHHRIQKFFADREVMFTVLLGSIPDEKEVAREKPEFNDDYYEMIGHKKIEEYEKDFKNRDMANARMNIPNLMFAFKRRIEKSPYHHLTHSYFAQNKAIRYEMKSIHGWAPGKDDFFDEDASSLAPVSSSHGLVSLREKYELSSSPNFDDSLSMKINEQNYLSLLEELYLRYVTAMEEEYKTQNKAKKWYLYPQAGLKGSEITTLELRAIQRRMEASWMNPDDQPTLLESIGRDAIELSNSTYSIGRFSPYGSVITRQDMRRRRQGLKKAEEWAMATSKLVSGTSKFVYGLTEEDSVLYALHSKYEVDRWPSYQRFVMFREVISEQKWSDFHAVNRGEKGYLVGRGFVSREEYTQEMSKPSSRRKGSIIDMMTGEYHIRENRTYGPFMTDWNGKYIPSVRDFRHFISNRSTIHMYNRLKALNYTDYQMQQFQLSINFIDPVLNTMLDYIEWFFNEFIGFFANLLGFNINLDIVGGLNSLLNTILSSIQNIPSEIEDKGTAFLNRYVVCNLPQNVDGTELYSPFCFPALPETRLDFINAGADSSIPIQIPWPSGLINQKCVNTYNGDPNLFSFERSNNCPVPDGAPRPFCPTCDYCERDYDMCSDVGVTSVLDTIAYIGGVLPLGADLFYRGGIATRDLEFVGVLIGLIFVAVFQGPLVVGPQFIIVPLSTWIFYFVIWTIDVVFDGFFDGSGGGLPWGMVFMGLFFASIYFLPVLYVNNPQLGIIFSLMTISFVINVFVPFPSFNEVFNINSILSSAFDWLNRAPTVAKLIDWQPMINRLDRFTYASGSVPAIDTFCFFWTFNNIAWLFVIGFFFYWTVTYVFLLIAPIVLFILDMVNLLFEIIRKIRLWMLRQDVQTLRDEFDQQKTKLKNLMFQGNITMRALLSGSRNTRSSPSVSSNIENDNELIIQSSTGDKTTSIISYEESQFRRRTLNNQNL